MTPLMFYVIYPEKISYGINEPLPKLKLLNYARKLVSRGADVNFVSENIEYGQSLLI
jgi:hypothetical protein